MYSSRMENTVQERVTMADAMAGASNLHKWIFAQFADSLLPNSVTLDVGAGHAGYAKMLASVSRKVIVSDVDEQAVRRIQNDIGGLSNVESVVMDGVDISTLRCKVDNVVALNVVEHIADDAGFVRNCGNSMRSGGRLVLLCPAFPFLFSRIDSEAGHYRRYRRRELEKIVSAADFTILTSRYLNVAGFFGWLVNKAFCSGVNSFSTNTQVVVYDKYLWLFKPFEMLSRFIGLSVLVVGEKK